MTNARFVREEHHHAGAARAAEAVLDGPARGGVAIVDIAKQVVRTSLNLTDQDVFMVHAWSHTTELASQIAREAIKVGAETQVDYFDDDLWLADFVERDPKYDGRKSRVSANVAEVVTAEVELGGPKDPKVFARTKPERMAAMEGWWKEIADRKRERKVRSAFVGLGFATPQRARKYGASYPTWRRAIKAALGYDLKRLAATGQLVSKRLAGAKEVQVTGNGTDLTLNLSGRDAFVNDGIIDANDIARGALNVSLPTGRVDIAPIETKAEGTVVFPMVPLWGKLIRDLKFQFDSGRLVDYDASKNVQAFDASFKPMAGDKDRIGWLSVGLNPKAAYVRGLMGDIVAGAVSIGIGANDEMGGANKGVFGFGGTLANATLQTDGATIVEAGMLKR